MLLGIDLTYPGFGQEFAKLRAKYPAFSNHFQQWAVGDAAASLATMSVVEVAFDSSYYICKFSFLSGQLALLARSQDGVFAFTTIVAPVL